MGGKIEGRYRHNNGSINFDIISQETRRPQLPCTREIELTRLLADNSISPSIISEWRYIINPLPYRKCYSIHKTSIKINTKARLK